MCALGDAILDNSTIYIGLIAQLGLPMEVLQPILGSKVSTWQQLVASSSRQSKIVCVGAVAQNQHPGVSKQPQSNAHGPKQAPCAFKPSSLFYGQFGSQKWQFLVFFRTAVMKVHGNH